MLQWMIHTCSMLHDRGVTPHVLCTAVCAVGAYRGAGIGAIADVYRPDQRGLAIGILMVSTLVGPVIGPLLGGFLAEGRHPGYGA